jgi:hypothetical protein
MTLPRFWFLTALTVAAAVSRIVPHPLNFAPFAAIALFGAATFPGRWSAVVVTFASLLLGDLLLQLTYLAGWQPNWGFHQGQWVVYACLIPSVLLGFAIRGRRNFATVASATLAGSVFFFVVTNFAVWANGSGVSYPRTYQGLLLCYEAAIPFFRNTLAGDAFYATALFGGLALAESKFPALRSGKPVPSKAVQEVA